MRSKNAITWFLLVLILACIGVVSAFIAAAIYENVSQERQPVIVPIIVTSTQPSTTTIKETSYIYRPIVQERTVTTTQVVYQESPRVSSRNPRGESTRTSREDDTANSASLSDVILNRIIPLAF